MSVDVLPPTLPDLLVPGLDLVFAGINPGERSARRGHYYGHPGNAFWRMLGASPLVARPVTCEDDATLAHPLDGGLRIGFTDVVKRVLTDSSGITATELAASAPAFRARIAQTAPRAVCFTSTRAFEAIYPKAWRSNGWGRQVVPPLDASEVWVVPSPSGRAAAYHREAVRVLEDLAASLRGTGIPSTPTLPHQGGGSRSIRAAAGSPPPPRRGRAGVGVLPQ